MTSEQTSQSAPSKETLQRPSKDQGERTTDEPVFFFTDPPQDCRLIPLPAAATNYTIPKIIQPAITKPSKQHPKRFRINFLLSE